MTLYRTSAGSRIIPYLLDAAQNGKQVAVVVELMARFDESANIRWAENLEEAGVHVTYGVVGLKTHSKVIFVVRRDFDGLRRYAHIGTGNYHAGTARIYSDLGMLTCDRVIAEDLTELFNYLTTGYAPERNYRKLLPSPRVLKKRLAGQNRAGDCHIVIRIREKFSSRPMPWRIRISRRPCTGPRWPGCRWISWFETLPAQARYPRPVGKYPVISIVGRFLEQAVFIIFRITVRKSTLSVLLIS